jgi:hypothetical protein
MLVGVPPRVAEEEHVNESWIADPVDMTNRLA